MIEVEKKFQPTDEQLEKMLEGAEFLGDVVNHDIYYDYADYRLFKEDIKFRNRNGNFELKVKFNYNADREIEDEEEIKKYFNTNSSLEDFIENNLQKYIDYEQKRKKYKKDGFTIDVDELNFGVNSCDIELLVQNEGDVKEAEKKLFEFISKYNLEVKDLLSKRGEYLKRFDPELFKELYEDK